MKTHNDKVLRGEVVGLVLEIERVEPLKERMVESKLQLGVVFDCTGQLTCKLWVKCSSVPVTFFHCASQLTCRSQVNLASIQKVELLNSSKRVCVWI